ncbi:MAG: glycerophosphodiester phosphodiesterase [Bacteroidia bacterium]|nr:glycerophosphodiester phosphodiesterase [Bacteroidia bacterium]
MTTLLKFSITAATLVITACTSSTNKETLAQKDSVALSVPPIIVPDSIDIQGHRGCRGLYPENTIAAFIHAMELGVTTLEMDIVTTIDRKLVVSHEAYMRSEICIGLAGNSINLVNEKEFNIYKMNYDSVAQYDCGSKYAARFPDQKKLVEHKPLLRSVLLKVVEYCTTHNVPVPQFNIEIKTDVEGDDIFHPNPAIVAQLLYDELHKLKMLETVTVQSFDVRALQAFKRIDSNVPISLLVENKLSLEENLAQLRFMPQIYSCDYALVTPQLISNAHARHIKVIPWTVNEQADMLILIGYGVDGIITDYPNRITHQKTPITN